MSCLRPPPNHLAPYDGLGKICKILCETSRMLLTVMHLACSPASYHERHEKHENGPPKAFLAEPAESAEPSQENLLCARLRTPHIFRDLSAFSACSARDLLKRNCNMVAPQKLAGTEPRRAS